MGQSCDRHIVSMLELKMSGRKKKINLEMVVGDRNVQKRKISTFIDNDDVCVDSQLPCWN